NPSGLFLNGDNLVVFSSEYGDTWRMVEGSAAPVPISADITHVIVYDVTDRARPMIKTELTLPGTYDNGRMIGDVIYAITRDSISSSDPIMPVIYEGTDVITKPSVWCPPIPMNQYNLYTITSFDLSGTRDVQAASFLMGWDNTLYVSPDNAYMAYKKWSPYWWGWNLRSLSSLGSDDGEESVVHRFSLENGTITYKASGTIPGYLLNQFSLDESAGYLRVATTNEQYQKDTWVQDNNVYILSSNLEITGRLEHLAPGERIYSARFMGDILYLVTFKQTDPLFVIDLSNPNQPGILGELKIPGYSDYLHPYDSTHLIGIGKDTEENEGGGVIPTGVKIAFFDVSDLNNPKLVDSRVIGEKGSSSEILNDHKAFLLDKEKSIMVLPIKEIFRIPIPGSTFKDSYTTASWQGAYVLGIDPSIGFVDQGKVEQDQVRPNDYYWSGSTVKRSVVMDSVLYTVSDDRIIGSDLENHASRLLLIDLQEQQE
ncbi:MAG: beta-propeller domain-containing protein, partial [Methanobacteriota archaeon]